MGKLSKEQKLVKLETACRIVLARFRTSVGVKGDAMQDFIKKGSMKEVIVALKLR